MTKFDLGVKWVKVNPGSVLLELSYTMLHTKSQGHRSIGSGEEDFFKVFTLYGHGGHVGHVTQTI